MDANGTNGVPNAIKDPEEAMNARAAAALDTDTEDEPEIDSRIQLPTEKDKIFKIELALLRPTQLAVGYEQVMEKAAKITDKRNKLQRKWEKDPQNNKDPKKAFDEWLRGPKKIIPLVLGPGNTMHLIDHHHLARALIVAGVETCYAAVAVLKETGMPLDLSHVSERVFWDEMMDRYNLIWRCDNKGVEIPKEQMPAALGKMTVATLPDDPYRSLAALVRKSDPPGYNKSDIPFAEFKWAQALRNVAKIPLPDTAPNGSDFTAATAAALKWAASQEAADMYHNKPSSLPGFIEPSNKEKDGKRGRDDADDDDDHGDGHHGKKHHAD